MTIISAAEALRLPSAQLTDDDVRVVNKILTEIDAGIRRSMHRNGFEFQTNCTNAAAMFEVATVLQDRGYVVNCQPIVRPPRIQGGPPTHEGYTITCAPSREAIAESRRDLQ